MFKFLKKTKKTKAKPKEINKIDKKLRQRLVLHETKPKGNKVYIKGQETWYYNALSSYAVNYTFGLPNPDNAREVAPDMYITPDLSPAATYARLAATDLREAILEDTDLDLHQLYLTKYKGH